MDEQERKSIPKNYITEMNHKKKTFADGMSSISPTIECISLVYESPVIAL